MAEALRQWVIDTSSLLSIRETFGRAGEGKVFLALTALVSKGSLFFPPQVYEELERGRNSKEAGKDPAFDWVKRVRSTAEKRADFDIVKEVLAVAPELIDPDKPYEQADPYVLAVALDIRGLGFDVTVVTDDNRDKPGKTSLATASGMMGIPSVPLMGFSRVITL